MHVANNKRFTHDKLDSLNNITMISLLYGPISVYMGIKISILIKVVVPSLYPISVPYVHKNIWTYIN